MGRVVACANCLRMDWGHRPDGSVVCRWCGKKRETGTTEVARPHAVRHPMRFMGALGFGDCETDPASGLVTIDRRDRGPIPVFTGLLPQESAEALKAAEKDSRPVSLYAPLTRGPRPGVVVSVSIPPSEAGLPMEEAAVAAASRAFAAMAPGALPEGPVEAWLLPVVYFGYDFLFTPVLEGDERAATAA